MRKILIRLDDICPKMDHSKFDKFKDLFTKYNVHPIIGVVPDCKDNLLNINDEDPLFWEKIKDLQKKRLDNSNAWVLSSVCYFFKRSSIK